MTLPVVSPRRQTRTPLRLLSVLVLSVTITSCGIPENSEPQAIGDDEARVPLAESSTPPTADPSGDDTVTLFFLQSDRLEQRNRSAEATLGPADAVRLLLEGTTEEEAGDDLVSAIPAETELMGDELTGGVLELGLSEEMSTVAGETARRAFAQMVYTATRRFNQVEEVSFRIDGDPVQVPTDDADEAVVDPADFTSLRPL